MFSNLFGRNPSSKRFYEEGLKLYQQADTTKAVEKLSEAIRIETGKKDKDKKFLSIMHCLRGEIYLSVAVAILSQSDFVYALQYNPENESALNNLGIWFSIPEFITPDYARSLEYFDKALAIRPRKDIQLNKACIKIQSGDNSGCDDLRQLEAEGYELAKTALERFCNKR